MAPGVPLTGNEWLNRVTFDVVFYICWFLDVQSVVRLGSVGRHATVT